GADLRGKRALQRCFSAVTACRGTFGQSCAAACGEAWRGNRGRMRGTPMKWRSAAAVVAGTALAGMTGIAGMRGGASAARASAATAVTKMAVTKAAVTKSAAAAQASPPSGHWGGAHPVDLSALHPGNGPAGVDALSCATPGNCSAG